MYFTNFCKGTNKFRVTGKDLFLFNISNENIVLNSVEGATDYG